MKAAYARGLMRSLPRRIQESVTRSARMMAVRQLVEVAPGSAVLLGICAVGAGVLPNIVRISLGVLIGQIPRVVASGFRSGTADHAMVITLAVAVLSYLGSLLIEPVRLSAADAAKVRVTYATQARLMDAVSWPAGVSHLEDSTVLNHLAAAQGQLMSYLPAGAAATLAQVIGTRLSGILACAVLAWFRPWLGALVLVIWLAIRRPMRKAVLAQVYAYGGKADIMRRAVYFRDLATKPLSAKEIRVFGLGSWAADRFRAHWRSGMRETWQVAAKFNVAVARLVGLVAGAYAVGVGTIALAVRAHEIGLAAVAVLLPTLFATASAGSVGWPDVNLEWMLSGQPSLGKLEARIRATTGPLAGEATPPQLNNEVRLERVSFRYPGAEAVVFDELDLVIPAGKATALVGANGVGKTTLVKLIARLIEPSSGRILVDGADLRQIDPRQWQRKVGVVFQDFTRFPFSVRDNVALGAVESMSDETGIAAATRLASADTFIKELPAGWSTVVSPKYCGGVELSGGQWQRVALARALFAVRHGATLLVLDEPTAWLDVEAEADFFDRFLEITKDLTTIVVSHRFSTVRRADHICVLDGGRLTEEGSHAELLALGGSYARMFQLQAARFIEPGSPAGVASGQDAPG
jgi:ATP-binding cassette subfamily B protein